LYSIIAIPDSCLFGYGRDWEILAYSVMEGIGRTLKGRDLRLTYYNFLDDLMHLSS